MPEPDGPAALRWRVGLLCAAFGAAHLLPALFVLLSAGGPAPVAVSARAWSAFYFAHFVALVCTGYGYLLWRSSRSKVFHGGPMLDFTIGLGALVIVESLGRGWLPGLFLILFGLRVATGRPLLGR